MLVLLGSQTKIGSLNFEWGYEFDYGPVHMHGMRSIQLQVEKTKEFLVSLVSSEFSSCSPQAGKHYRQSKILLFITDQIIEYRGHGSVHLPPTP